MKGVNVEKFVSYSRHTACYLGYDLNTECIVSEFFKKVLEIFLLATNLPCFKDNQSLSFSGVSLTFDRLLLFLGNQSSK